MTRIGNSIIRRGLAVAIACLALSGAVIAKEQGKKPANAAADETAAPKKKPSRAASDGTTAPKPEIPPAAERAQRLTDRMKERLGLTEEQLPRVAEINLEIAKKVDAIRAEAAGDPNERFNKVRSVQGERDKELKQVLNKEQWNDYTKMRNEMREKARDGARQYRRQGGGAGGEDPVQ